MGCLLAYEPEIPGIFAGVGVRNAHFANASNCNEGLWFKTENGGRTGRERTLCNDVAQEAQTGR